MDIEIFVRIGNRSVNNKGVVAWSARPLIQKTSLITCKSKPDYGQVVESIAKQYKECLFEYEYYSKEGDHV